MLLHGLGEDSSAWSPVVPVLAGRHEVFLLDLPGFGASPPLPPGVLPTSGALAQAVAAELDRLGLAAPHVAGVSLGGRVALELARRGRARSVVAIAPNGTATPLEQGYLASVLLVKRLWARGLLPLARLPGGQLLARAFFAVERARPRRLSAPDARGLLRSFARSPGFLPTLAAATVDPALGMGRVRCPVLLVQGGRDVLVPGQPDRFLLLLPDARLTRVPGAGHAVVSDAPEVLAATVLDFLAAAQSRGYPAAREA